MIFSFRPNQLKKLRKYRQSFGAKAREKGKALYEKKGLSNLSAPEKNLAEAKVAGLEVTLEYSEDGWESWCTCPTELECEHSYALGLAILEGDETPEPEDDSEKALDEKLSDALGRKLTGGRLFSRTIARDPVSRCWWRNCRLERFIGLIRCLSNRVPDTAGLMVFKVLPAHHDKAAAFAL